MADLTQEAAIDLAMKRLGERIMALSAGAAPSKAWAAVSAALNAVPPAAGTTTGSCCYKVNGQNVCIDNVTKAECDSLGGNFSTQTCAQRTDCR
jgi:hypothetical protein